MTTLVTGANGFVARHLLRAVRRAFDGRVIGADVSGATSNDLDELRVVDLADPAITRQLVAHAAPERVFHLVGRTQGTEDEIRSSNVDTAANLLAALRETGSAARVVLVGSAAEYGVVPLDSQPVTETFAGAPGTAYGRAKQAVTALAAAAARVGQPVVVARPFNIIGPGIPPALVAGALIARIRRSLEGPAPRSISVGRTTAIRDFVAVEDVADGLVRMAVSGRAGVAYNLCTGEGHAISELLVALLGFAGASISVDQDPTLLREADVDQMLGSSRRAEADLGWRPTIPFLTSVRAAWDATAGA